jgi:hypothetical protein
MTTETIVHSLLEVDGACRDINFSEHISTLGACSLLDAIEARWTLIQATDREGNAVQPGRLKACLSQENGALSTVWNGPAIPHQFQAYFYWPRLDRVFCELTFFPEDLDPPRFALEDLLRTLALFVQATQSREYYVRFEDASWRHTLGNGQESVIFSHETVRL